MPYYIFPGQTKLIKSADTQAGLKVESSPPEIPTHYPLDANCNYNLAARPPYLNGKSPHSGPSADTSWHGNGNGRSTLLMSPIGLRSPHWTRCHTIAKADAGIAPCNEAGKLQDFIFIQTLNIHIWTLPADAQC